MQEEKAARGVRERVRLALRAELTQAAVDLFESDGYAGTTVGAIAARAGVTERTFFRHFSAKEDPVLEPLEQMGTDAAERLAGRPADEPALPALRAAFDVVIEIVTRDPAMMRVIMRLNRSNPELRQRHRQKQDEWVDALAAVMAVRLGRPENAPEARLPCAVAMAALEKALAVCAAEDRFDQAGREFDDALGEVASMFLGDTRLAGSGE